jgi:hypothetical protein
MEFEELSERLGPSQERYYNVLKHLGILLSIHLDMLQGE